MDQRKRSSGTSGIRVFCGKIEALMLYMFGGFVHCGQSVMVVVLIQFRCLFAQFQFVVVSAIER